MKKIAIVALAAAATFITSCDIERMPYDKYTGTRSWKIRMLRLMSY